MQTARAKAVREYEHAAKEGLEESGEAEGSTKDKQAGRLLRQQLFDAALLSWLTSVPPDRVGVSRLLRLGDTLKPTATGFDLDLSRPGQHKTSAAFGPTITAVPAPTAKLLTAWLGATGRTGSAAQPHVFVPGADAAKPLRRPRASVRSSRLTRPSRAGTVTGSLALKPVSARTSSGALAEENGRGPMSEASPE